MSMCLAVCPINLIVDTRRALVELIYDRDVTRECYLLIAREIITHLRRTLSLDVGLIIIYINHF